MAFVFASNYIDEETVAANSLVIPMPVGHASGDLLLVQVSQDAGTGTFSITSGTGWTHVSSFGAGGLRANSQRTGMWYKLAASSSEGDLTIGSTLSEQIGAIVMVIRGVHQTTPIDVNNSASATVSSDQFSFPSVTAGYDNELFIYGGGFDVASTVVFEHQNKITRIKHNGTINAGVSLYSGYVNQTTAAVRPDYKLNRATGGNGITYVIGIRDDGNAKKLHSLASFSTTLRHFGVFSLFDPTDTYSASDTIAATIDGFSTVSTYSTPTLSTTPSVTYGQNGYTSFGDTTSSASKLMTGPVIDFVSAVDLSDSIISAQLSHSNVTSAIGREGFYWVFADSSGNWAAYNISENLVAVYPTLYGVNSPMPIFLDVELATPKDSSGTIDWSDITKMGVLQVRGGTSAPAFRGQLLKDLLVTKKQDIQIIDGGNDAISFSENLSNMINIWHTSGLTYITSNSVLQGNTQILTRLPIQIGDGTNKTIFNYVSSSLTTPLRYTDKNGRRQINIVDNSLEVRIKTSSNDSIQFTGGLLTANTKTAFVIDDASSASATFDFSGLTVKGYSVTNNVSGIVINNASFFGCYSITLNGGSLDSCLVSDSIETAIITDEPDNISDCTFVSAGTGHAIEITATGTFTFSGNSFSGYGADGTTDAAIYNNSGGAVTINIAGGGGTPTVRNGSGASTTINNATTVQVTAKNANSFAAVSGATVLIEADSGGDLPAGDTVTITRSGSTASVAHTSHGLVSGAKVVIRGANQDEYNGVFTITNVTTHAYDYTVSGSPATPATGTILATAVIISGTTDSFGVISNASFSYTSDQPITGKIRKATTGTKYKTAAVIGTITSSGLDSTVLLIPDE